MTLRDINERYSCKGAIDGKYLLFDEQIEGRLTNHKYVGYLTKKGSNYYLGDVKVKAVNELTEALKQYHGSLEYDVEYYNPMWRKGFFEEVIVSHYMQSLGFRSNRNSFILTIDNPLGGTKQVISTTISGLELGKEIPEEVTVILRKGEGWGWTEIKCKREVKEIIAAIGTLLKPLMQYNIAQNQRLLDKLSQGINHK